MDVFCLLDRFSAAAYWSFWLHAVPGRDVQQLGALALEMFALGERMAADVVAAGRRTR